MLNGLAVATFDVFDWLLILCEYVSVVGEEVLGFVVQMAVHNVDEGGGSLEVLQVDVAQDPGVDDHVVLHVVVRHVDAAVPHLRSNHQTQNQN